MEHKSATFNHKGVEITLGANGKFSAVTAEGRIMTASLDAMKKRLEKQKQFESFKAFQIASWGVTKIKDVTVIGIEKSRRRHASDQFKTADGSTHAFLFAETPENRAAALAYIDIIARHKQITEQQDKEAREAYDAIQQIRPNAAA